MVGGIVFQLVSITIFAGFAVDFAWRTFTKLKSPTVTSKPALCLFAAASFSVLLVYIRSVYRTIELMHGWTSSTMKNEKLLIGLDGAMMVPAVVIFNIIHPGWILPMIEQQEKRFNTAWLSEDTQEYQLLGRQEGPAS